VAAQTSEQGGLATRYARALFDLADSKHQLDAVAADLTAIAKMTDESADLQRLMNSPVISRAAQGKAIAAVLQAAGIGEITRKFVGLVAQNRRLFAVPAMIKAFQKILAKRRGEMTAEVTAARPLSAEQQAAVSEAIRRAAKSMGAGSKVSIDVKVDPSLLGGLIVKVGSRMIDSSLKSKLQKLQLAMKGVG
jgi:F-type H+-transporting ATPase subunit delta